MPNKSKTGEILKRRDFFRTLTRAGILTSLLGGSAYLMMNREGEGDDCQFDFICRGCRKNRFCQLPEASLFRLKKRKWTENEKRG